MICVPPASLEVVNFAIPLLSAPVPSVVVPSLNVTVPVGVPEVVAFTVAVNVTAWPKVDGFSEETTAVGVAWRVIGSTNTTVSSSGVTDPGLQLLHVGWKPFTFVAGFVWAK